MSRGSSGSDASPGQILRAARASAADTVSQTAALIGKPVALLGAVPPCGEASGAGKAARLAVARTMRRATIAAHAATPMKLSARRLRPAPLDCICGSRRQHNAEPAAPSFVGLHTAATPLLITAPGAAAATPDRREQYESPHSATTVVGGRRFGKSGRQPSTAMLERRWVLRHQ